MKLKIKTPLEYDEQKVIFEWAFLQQTRYPELKYMHASLSGVKLPIGLAMKCKRAGMKRGVPDIDLPAKRGEYSGLNIELKIGKNKPSKEQIETIEFLNSQGRYACVCYGAREAIDKIIWYLEMK